MSFAGGRGISGCFIGRLLVDSKPFQQPLQHRIRGQPDITVESIVVFCHNKYQDVNEYFLKSYSFPTLIDSSLLPLVSQYRVQATWHRSYPSVMIIRDAAG
jgi:hypothetical protein